MKCEEVNYNYYVTVHDRSMEHMLSRVYNSEEGEYPSILWYSVTTLSRVHDLWSDIHMVEVSRFVVCGLAS